MKDDSLNDTHITRPGGYCPKCDTVYDRPHECVGKPLRIVNIDKALDTNVYERQIWNEAIEAAASKVKSNNKLMIAILKLKK